MSDETTRPVRPGRPRDPGLEDRVLDAAMALYAEAGWSGFTFDALSRVASVGKGALNRGWVRPQELMLDTLRQRWYHVDRIDTGTLRGGLVALARVCLDSPTGRTARCRSTCTPTPRAIRRCGISRAHTSSRSYRKAARSSRGPRHLDRYSWTDVGWRFTLRSFATR